jgi:hypothetical protein
MPAEQRGSLYKTSSGHGIRWRDDAGNRRHKSGFHSRSAARRWLNNLLDAGLRDERLSLAELTEQYLEAHAQVRDARTIRTLRERMKRPLDAFGDLELRDLEKRAREIAAWQATLPEGSRYGIMQAFRQTLEAGIRWKLIRENPAKLAGPNPQPRRTEIVPFAIEEVDRLALELGPLYGPLVVFAAETGRDPRNGSRFSTRTFTARTACS